MSGFLYPPKADFVCRVSTKASAIPGAKRSLDNSRKLYNLQARYGKTYRDQAVPAYKSVQQRLAIKHGRSRSDDEKQALEWQMIRNALVIVLQFRLIERGERRCKLDHKGESKGLKRKK